MKALAQVYKVFSALSYLLFPAFCQLCSSAGSARRDICSACSADLLLNSQCCQRCALPLGTQAPLCAECLQSAPAFDQALVPFKYQYPLDRLLQKLKFSNDLAAGRALGDLFCDRVDADDLNVDCIVPVPLHPDRQRERGYNQALEIARQIGRRHGIAINAKVLQRIRNTTPQSGLSATDRKRNLKGAFELIGVVKDKRIALVDDVVTTGTTARECARILKQGGAEFVVLCAVARVPR